MIVTLLDAFFRRFRPRGGWMPLLLTVLALLCLPAALSTQDNGASSSTLIVLFALAFPISLWLARSRLSARPAAFVAAVLGVLLIVVAVGRILPPLSLLWQEVGYALGWRGDSPGGDAAVPFATAASFSWQRLGALGSRLWWWGQAVAGNTPGQDPIVRELFTAALAWWAAAFGTWQIYRRHSALPGLAPTVIVVAIAAFFRSGMAFFYLVVCLYCTFWLVAICRLWTQTARWDQHGTDYPESLGFELALAFAPWLTVVLLIAAFFPVIYPRIVHRAFWNVAEEPWERAVQAAERFVGPIEDEYGRGLGYRPGEGGELPSAHLLAGAPEPGDTVVLYVTTSDPPPPRPDPDQGGEPAPGYPRRYWRARTFDTYAGQGWVNSPLESRTLSANQAMETMLTAGPDLLQQFERLAPNDTLIYAANSPYLSDSPMQAWERSTGDLAFLTGELDTYTILSRAPQPTAIDLRASSPVTSTLPAEFVERYIALPESVPQRVLDLARDVAGNAPTGYDRVQSIERYLRAYPYTLELPEPPARRDLVDYFLFERQEGYCDYYASAMVVMARAVGVPARLASGYAQGTYDHEMGRWAVTEQDAHSWVEVYFSGLGWVEFEPTAAQPSLDRSGGEAPTALALPPLPARTAHWWQQVPWGLVLVGCATLLLGALIVWLWRPRPLASAAQIVRDRQARLQRWGARLGHPLRDGQTPGEYARSLGTALHARGSRARWARARESGQEAPPAVEHLTGAFVHAQYSPEPIADSEGWQVRDLWTRLRRHLWVLWLALGLRKDEDEG